LVTIGGSIVAVENGGIRAAIESSACADQHINQLDLHIALPRDP
jgi:hypothetical protein